MRKLSFLTFISHNLYKLPDIAYVRIQVMLLQNLIAWSTLHTAIFQIFFRQRWFDRQFTKFSYHQSSLHMVPMATYVRQNDARLSIDMPSML